MIVVSMCTIPARKKSFLQVAWRILYEQTCPIDELHVWLNGYQTIDDDLPKYDRLVYHLEPDNPGPWIRYKVADWLCDTDIFVTIDDDLIHPVNYIEKGVGFLENDNEDCAICFSGISWDPLVDRLSYGGNRKLYLADQPLSQFRFVSLHMGQTGFYWAKLVRCAISFSISGFQTNDDMMIGYHLYRAGTRIKCCPKPAGWIREQDASRAAHALYRRDRDTRYKVFTELTERLGFDPTANILTETLRVPRRVLIFAETCPPLPHAETLDAYLRSLCAEGVSVHVIAPIPASLENMVQTHVDTPYHIHAVTVPEQGGRLDGVKLVKLWRDLRVQRAAHSALETMASAAQEKLLPSLVGYWPQGKQPVWAVK